MNTNSILSSVNTTNQTSNSFFKTLTIDKVKSDDFENLMASQKSSTQSNTKTTNENKTEIAKEKDSTQKLYDEIFSLLNTRTSNDELKLIKERLAQIQKMKEDGKSDDEIKAALKQLAMEIEEIRKNKIAVVVKKTDDNTNNSTNEITDSNKIVSDLKNMFQEIQDSLKNNLAKNKDKKNQMEISTNSSIYTAITSLQTNSSIKTKSVNDLASDYTYDEYKKLSAKDINEIFPWDKMPHENEKAQKLQLIATLSPDETLNQVLFDQAKNTDFNDISTRNFFDRTLATKRLEEAMLSFNQYETSDEEFLKTLSQKDKLALAKDSNNKVAKTVNYTDSLAKEIDGIVDAKTYFHTYEMSKNYFKDYGKDLSEYSQKYWPNEFALFDKVKSEYEKRASQNDNVLNQLTYNSKPNPLEINI